MFKQARLKLTLWYLVILTTVLLFFSAVIFRIGCAQLERSYHQAELRLRAQETGLLIPVPGNGRWLEKIEDSGQLSQELLSDFFLAKRELAKNLMILNVTILALSSVMAFFLAGKTLAPIEQMVMEQRRFVTDAAHELRTPITAMKTALEVSLRDKKISKTEALTVLAENLKDTQQLEKLSNQLLALASFQQDQSQLMLQKSSCLEIANNLQRKFRGVSQEKKIKLSFDCIEEEVLMDAAKIEQVLTILIDNAISYSDPGKKVQVSFMKAKKYLIVAVKDQGPGMSAKDQTEIFKRFYRADTARTKTSRKTGFGLGLAIAWQIVDLYGGKISVLSELKKGSTFTVTLPA